MAGKKFGQDRHKPPGKWVQTTPLVDVVGWRFHVDNVESFFRAVQKAERNALPYGVQVVMDSGNPHDPNALAVYGFALVKGWFRTAQAEWHVGYLPAETAAELQRDLLSKAVPIAAELYSLFENADYREIRIIVLAPPGRGVKVRTRGQVNPDLN